MGHEYVGIVEQVGDEVTTIKPGQFVIGSFFASDNTCEICRPGYQSSCVHREPVGAEGAQAEYLRVPLADGTCVADAQLYYRQAPVGESEALLVSEDPVLLRCRGGGVLKLSIGHRYTLVETEDRELGPWKASTRAYLYRLDDGEGREQVSWHWHPSGRSKFHRPHLHVGAGPTVGRHLPTGRVSVESVVRLLLAEMDVVPRRGDWARVLDEVGGTLPRVPHLELASLSGGSNERVRWSR